jgi:hypothetical protein
MRDKTLAAYSKLNDKETPLPHYHREALVTTDKRALYASVLLSVS